MTRYEAAATAANMVRTIRSNAKPWTVANAALTSMLNLTLFTSEEVASVEAFLRTRPPINVTANSDDVADAVRELVRSIEPGAVIE